MISSLVPSSPNIKLHAIIAAVINAAVRNKIKWIKPSNWGDQLHS